MRTSHHDEPLSAGQLFTDGECGVWVWLADSDVNHIYQCAVAIGGGEVTHQSRIPLPHTAVYGSEVMW